MKTAAVDDATTSAKPSPPQYLFLQKKRTFILPVSLTAIVQRHYLVAVCLTATALMAVPVCDRHYCSVGLVTAAILQKRNFFFFSTNMHSLYFLFKIFFF